MSDINQSAIDIEQALLGTLLIWPDMINQLARLSPDDFVDGIHAAICSSMMSLSAAGKPVTPLTLGSLHEGLCVGDIPMAVYLTRLMNVATSSVNVAGYIDLVREMRARRMMIDAAHSMIGRASDLTLAPGLAAVDSIRDLDDIVAQARRQTRSWGMIDDAVAAAIASAKAGGDKGVTTGLADLDEVLGGGWHKSEFAVIGARPSMGKSALGVSTAVAAAKAGHGVLIFSLEMTQDMIGLRALSAEMEASGTSVSYEHIRQWRGIDVHIEKRMNEALGAFHGLSVAIDDEFGLSMAEIVSRCRQHATRFEHAGKSLDLVIVDHLGKVRASDRYAGQKVHEVGEKSNAMLGLAKDMGVAAIAFHQLSRGVEQRKKNNFQDRPGMADLRDCGNLEEDAHNCLFIYRQAYYTERERRDTKEKEKERLEYLKEVEYDIELIVDKNRNGPCKSVHAYCDIANNVIRDKDMRHG